MTDAGTPGISDPGAVVVQAVRRAGLRVAPIPGASALTAAMSVAGLVDGAFEFRGFLPVRQVARRKLLERLVDADRAVVFYEAPHRIRETLGDLAAVVQPDRLLTLCRELTKLFEEIDDVPVGEALAWLDASAHRERGEFVLVLHPSATDRADRIAGDGRAALTVLLRELPASQAARLAAELTGARRADLYDEALRLKAESAE